MKTWIRDRQGTEMIASLYNPDGEVKMWIAPTKDNPAETISSDRDDGYEHIVFEGETHLVQSIDLEWENSVSRVSPTSFKPARHPHGFIEALNDYCQDYYIHYDGFPVEFEYKDKVYPFEYFIDYIEDKTNA